MGNWKFLKGQVLASTRPDSQGESHTYDSLSRLASLFSSKSRLPLHQRHDMALETVGHVENFLVVPDAEDPAHWVLVGDVTFRDIEIDEALRGFSYSVTDRLVGDENPLASAFLPYPYYNDAALMSGLVKGLKKTAAGAWRKKEADPQAVGLLVAFVLFIAAPAYTNYWNNTIAPLLSRFRSHLSSIGSIEFCQTLTGPRGETYAAYFIPPRGSSSDYLTLSLVSDALKRTADFISHDHLAQSRGVFLARLSYVGSRYELTSVQYLDGSVVNHA